LSYNAIKRILSLVAPKVLDPIFSTYKM